MKPYPKTKPSGVEWLGDVPEHWEVKRLKYSVSINDDSLPETTAPDFEFEYVDIGSVNATDGITTTETLLFEGAPSRARRKVQDGDTIVSTVRTYLRAIAPVIDPPENLIVSTGFAVVRARKVEPGFLGFALRETSFVETVVSRSTGVSYPAVNASDVGRISIPLPPPPEQTAIAGYLDRETGRIDELVGKKRELIERLKEKRTALISRTVTRGLPADLPHGTLAKLEQIAGQKLPLNPPLKASGIDWLGDVPEHWEVRRAKHICEGIIDCKNRTPDYFDDGEYYVLRTTDVKEGRVNIENALRTDEANYKEWTLRGAPRKDDVFFTREAPAGEAALFDGEAMVCMGQRMMYFRVDRRELNPQYLLFVTIQVVHQLFQFL